MTATEHDCGQFCAGAIDVTSTLAILSLMRGAKDLAYIINLYQRALFATRLMLQVELCQQKPDWNIWMGWGSIWVAQMLNRQRDTDACLIRHMLT